MRLIGQKRFYDYLYTHFGILVMTKSALGLESLVFTGCFEMQPNADSLLPYIDHEAIHDEYALCEEVRQVGLYCTGSSKSFNLELNPKGTAFQQTVWRQLTEIPFGETRTYTDVAHLIGNDHAVRAIGGAVGKNPIPLIIPCHRVIGKDGSMTGFSANGGIELKKRLLSHEGNRIFTE